MLAKKQPPLTLPWQGEGFTILYYHDMAQKIPTPVNGIT